MEKELFYYLNDSGKKVHFVLDAVHADKWKRFFLECGGSVYQSDYEYFLTTI